MTSEQRKALEKERDEILESLAYFENEQYWYGLPGDPEFDAEQHRAAIWDRRLDEINEILDEDAACEEYVAYHERCYPEHH